jgi:ribosome-interacting GTPase 1
MPTNLPPEAQEAERIYRAATTPDEKISALEEFIRLIPKHKGTDHLRADLRRKLSKLKASAEQARKKLGKRESAFFIDREGSGQVALVGMTNVGRSALVTALTNASPEVSESPYCTWTPTPGMMLVGGVQIQLIDTPPLNRDFVEPELMNLLRRVDLLLVVVDLQTHPIQQLEEAVDILQEHRIVPCRLRDQCEDERRIIFKPTLVVVNKNDDEETDEVFEIFCELLEDDWPMLPVSATTGRNLDRLKKAVFDRLDLIRVYSKPPGQEPNYDAPFVMKSGGTVGEFARKVHQDFYHNLKSARVWGSGVFDGQMVGREHVLNDEDVVELRI